ncbi:LamG-like jellyroll fold domain-containing protein [Nocardioides sp. zg-DK7169]|uniref:LamG-like jellyroll fold domain-containing protein n=1 Tax=Nocardioides sp. zg-DK7169 TaxID=2736600 RepID=UPI001553C9A2|nr:LamG-like jellyroll fold domain-containing protein [Nocardioides sp. zg-DK7169]NPC98090.1 DUF5011 domain-containing protein [Nocardioides sp. zg-DK7169]
MRIHRTARRAATAGLAGAVLTGTVTLVPGLAQAAVVPASSLSAVSLPASPLAAPPTPADPAPAAPAGNATRVEVPRADVLDVDLRDGTPTDHAQGIAPTVLGEPRFTSDAARARAVVSLDGVEDALKYPFRAEHAKIADGFAIECTFRYDAPTNPTSERALCGAKEAGGLATVANKAGLTFMAHIGGGYKNVSAPLTPGQWHHTLVTWDTQELVLYVDGAAVSRVAATGAYKAPSAGADSLVLGGDTQPGDAVNFRAQATLQHARVWSSALSAEQAAQLATDATVVPDAPQADVLDVDFTGERVTDQASGIEVRELGAPAVVDYAPLGRKVGRFDGSSAYYFPWTQTQYDQIKNTMSLECVFKYDADEFQANGAEDKGNLCGAKESGGFAIALYGDELSFNPHIGGAYRSTKHRLAKTDQWVHAVGTYDGASVKLYVNGTLVAEQQATGAVSSPADPTAWMMVVGGDAAKNRPSFTAPAHIAAARIFSDALDLRDVLALQHQTFGSRDGDDLVRVTASTPAAGTRIHRATRFSVELANAQAAGRDVVYALDGERIEPGQRIGAGLRAGTHAITVDGTDHFGNVIAERIEFTSANIPVAGGTETEQGAGAVTLAAVATNPGGGDVTTTFRAGTVVVAEQGTQGTLAKLPTTRDFTGRDVERIDTGLAPQDGVTVASPEAAAISYQRFDVPSGAGTEAQEVSWTGTVDPTREVHLRVWNGSRWASLDSARGVATGSVSLTGSVDPEWVVDGAVPVLVTGEDPFADDLDKPVADGFESPDDYDFAIAHLTDTQYLSEGAVEQETPQERATWAEAYTSITQWIADNAEQRKIAFAAHTGDLIENWFTAGRGGDLGYRANAMKEFEVASQAQQILDEAGVVNSVLPGNHDNLYATDNGPDALYNDYFGPERYQDLAQREGSTGWRTHDASYHPWKPGDNANSFNLFSAAGLDFVVVNLGFGVDAEEVAWANRILEQYRDRNAIVQTHAHTTPSTNPDGRGAGLSYDGNAVRNQVAAKNPNVFLVLSGHEHGVNIEVVRDLGEEHNNVVELLADYQFYTVPTDELGLTEIGGYDPDARLQFGSSFFRLLQIDVDRAEMSVDTYSALLDDFGATEYDDRSRYNGKEDDFRLPVQLETRTTSFATDAVTVIEPTDEVIGVDTARSGWPASVVWRGLEAGESYAWYSTSVDAGTGEEVQGEVGQMSVFTAQPAGTDTTAPVITAEAQTTLTHGAVFDALAGVTATDATDGDVSSEIRVVGTVDTTRLGVYTLVYAVADANGNQATLTRTVEVVAPPAPVSTARPVISAPGTHRPTVGQPVRVSMGEWSGNDSAEMRVQWFRDGTPIDGATGTEHVLTRADLGTTLTVTVSAKVVGNDPVVARSAGFEVAPAAAEQTRAASSVEVGLNRARIKRGGAAVLTVRVSSERTPTGQVVVKVGNRTHTTVRLGAARKGVVKVRLEGLKPGVHQVRARYQGNAKVKASASSPVRLTVVR